ncbi:MAG: metal ABC transporter ATP-binding protein [Opitutales bacterium]
MNRILLPITLLLAGLVGCATPPKKIGAQYVSPLVYKDYTNDQIIVEMDHVGQRTAVLYENLKKEANNDKLQTGLGLLVFWPALFLLEGGDGPEAQEYARLKGEYEALRKAAVQRGMKLDQLPPSPEEVLKAKKPGKDR